MQNIALDRMVLSSTRLLRHAFAACTTGPQSLPAVAPALVAHFSSGPVDKKQANPQDYSLAMKKAQEVSSVMQHNAPEKEVGLISGAPLDIYRRQERTARTMRAPLFPFALFIGLGGRAGQGKTQVLLLTCS